MIYRVLREVVATFIRAVSSAIGLYSMGAEEVLYRAVDREASLMISRIQQLAPEIMSRELSKRSINLPLKYNKQVIDNIYSQISIFKNSNGTYSKADIDRMKKIILTDKYSGASTSDIQKHLQESLDISKRRALLVARAESQNLELSVNDIYFREVSSDHDLIWISKTDARPDHLSMNGKKADEDGYFDTPWGQIKGPQEIPQAYRWNCRCTTRIVKKQL